MTITPNDLEGNNNECIILNFAIPLKILKV